MALIELNTWGAALAATTLALACSGTQLNDLGDVNSSGELEVAGAAGNEVPPDGEPVGGAPNPPGVIGLAGEPGVSGGGGSGGGNGGGNGGEGEGGHGEVEPGACTSGTNLLANGSFEGTGLGFPDEWRRFGTPAEAVIWDHNVAAEGESSVKMVMPTSYEYWSEQRIHAGCVTEGEVLRITGQYRSNRANTDIAVAVVVGDEFLDLPAPDEEDVWLPFAVQVIAPKPPFDIGLWSIGPFNDPATTLWFDDVQAVRVP